MTVKPDPVFVFAPGFLGRPEDGDLFLGLSCDLIKLDFFSPQGLLAQISPSENQQNLFFILSQRILEQIDLLDASVPVNLVGYSFGGRVLAHVFLARPDRFQKLFLISSHLGLESSEDKKIRKASDQIWANKFQSLNWSELMHEWNEQGVFAGGQIPVREEEKYLRKSLQIALEKLGLGDQQNLEQVLLQKRNRVIYICGEHDKKFVHLSQRYKELGFTTHMISDSGHRVLVDQPEEVLKALRQNR